MSSNAWAVAHGGCPWPRCVDVATSGFRIPHQNLLLAARRDLRCQHLHSWYGYPHVFSLGPCTAMHHLDGRFDEGALGECFGWRQWGRRRDRRAVPLGLARRRG
jgi:hypothetical protein